MLEEISEKIINERKYLYSNLKIFEKMGESGLCFLISPDKDLADILRELIIYYIKINLFYQNHDKSIFSMSIKELEDRILELPNITPGGAIYPKNESALIFSEICTSIQAQNRHNMSSDMRGCQKTEEEFEKKSRILMD